MEEVSEVVQAKHFHVVNDDGTVVAALGMMAEGGVLGILNKDGKTVATLSPDQHGHGKLGIYNKEAKPSSRLLSSATGGKMLIYNNDERIVAGLAVYQDGGALGIYDKDGEIDFRAPSKEAAKTTSNTE